MPGDVGGRTKFGPLHSIPYRYNTDKKTMAIIIGPLFSLEAHGSLGDVITYARLGRTNYSKIHFTPANPQSDKQIRRRVMTGWLTQTWSVLTESEKANFNDMATSWNLSPYHAWLKFNSQRWTSNLMPAKSWPLEIYRAGIIFEFTATQNGNLWTIYVKSLMSSNDVFSLRLQSLPTSDPTWYDNKTVHIAGPPTPDGLYNIFSFIWAAPDSSMRYFSAKLGSIYGGCSIAYYAPL